MKRFTCALALLLIVATTHNAQQKSAPELNAQQRLNLQVLDSVINTIRQNFYDRRFGGHDLNKMQAQYKPRVLMASDKAKLRETLNEMLSVFKVSHLAVLDGQVYTQNFAPEMNNSTSRRCGFDVTKYPDGKYFITNVLHESAADKAGLVRGDELLTVNGKAPAESKLLRDAGGDAGIPGNPHFIIITPPKGTNVTLKVLRTRTDSKPTTVTITPSEWSMIRASKASIGVIEHEGRKLGYIRFWHFLHGSLTQAFKRALKNEFADCDGLIVDLRGRGGSPMVMNACFEPFATPPAGGMGMRIPGFVPDYGMPKWDRPVVALQDAGSRSAKEVYAHNWKYKDCGPLIGESTPGAVLGSTFFKLPNDDQMIMPVQNARSLSFGQVELEANPVTPTLPVKDLVRYAAGQDTIKQAGIKTLYGMVKDLPKVEPKKDPEAGEAKEEGY